MAGRRAPREQASEAGSASLRRWLTAAGLLVAVMVSLSLLSYGAYRVRHFLIHDARFSLPAPPEGSFLSPGIGVEGAQNAQVSSIHAAFREDFGRSIYLIDLEQRRQQLHNVEWVKAATVSRIWPNRLLVRIQERTPVAYIAAPAEPSGLFQAGESVQTVQPLLVDEEGVILRPRPGVSYRLPIVAGIRPQDALDLRRRRIQRAVAAIRDLGDKMNAVVELNVEDPNNVEARCEYPEHSVILVLGDRMFRQRMERFEKHFPELRRYLPPVSVLDLRLDDRITEKTSDARVRKNPTTAQSEAEPPAAARPPAKNGARKASTSAAKKTAKKAH